MKDIPTIETPVHLTLRDARDLFYKIHGFHEDGGVSNDRWSPLIEQQCVTIPSIFLSRNGEIDYGQSLKSFIFTIFSTSYY